MSEHAEAFSLGVNAGYFQPEQRQTGCISCGHLGSFYQESAAQSICDACPINTERLLGVGLGENKSQCQCVKGALKSGTSQQYLPEMCFPVQASTA